MSNQLKWPGINISESDREITIRIRQHDGVLTSIDMKDLLMLSAALAVKKGLPPLANTVTNERLDKQISHSTLMNQRDYEDFRQYIALIYYLTGGDKKLETLNDTSVMVKNFIDYAQRGLRYLEASYINSRSGSDDLVDELISLLAKKKS